MVTAYVSFGGNTGNVPETFARALDLVTASAGVAVETVSPLYKTEPQGDADQEWFHNQIVAFSCPDDMQPEDFLTRLLDVETRLGRVRDPGRRFGPRVLDLDLLLWGDTVQNSHFLTLPHPRMTERAFVLVPLADIAPTLEIPQAGRVDDILKRLTYSIKGTSIYQDAP